MTYLFTEIGNAMAVCGPGLCVGIIAIVLAVRGGLPIWLRVLSVIGGVGGILAPFYFTYFVCVLWAVVMAITIIVNGRTAQSKAARPAASMV